jgi:hypothetical protein
MVVSWLLLFCAGEKKTKNLAILCAAKAKWVGSLDEGKTRCAMVTDNMMTTGEAGGT